MGRLALLLLPLLLSARAAASDGWEGDERLALRVLKDLVRMDTSNPPGNEIVAARYLKEIFDAEGIPSEILTSTGTRASLVARLKGDGSRRPLLLMCHTDVVPAERAGWTVDPFGAEEKDGYLYGRGTADVKGMCAAEAAVLLRLKRLGAPLARDVIFLAQADEESGGSGRHVDWLVERHWDKLGAEFGLNEGGNTLWEDGRIRSVDLQCGEKQYLDLRFIAEGTPGHASLPRPDNAVHALARAMGRLAAWEGDWEITPLALSALEGAAERAEPELARALRGLRGRRARRAARRVAELAPEHGALLRDSCAVTMLSAGYKSNVIPARAEATANCRLLPGRDIDSFVRRLTRLLEEPSVRVEYARPGYGPSPPMPADSELFRAVAAVAREFAGAPVRPYMAPWSTDSEIFRARGVLVYGLDLPLPAEDNRRTHGDDERIPIAGLHAYLRLLYGVVTRVAGR